MEDPRPTPPESPLEPPPLAPGPAGSPDHAETGRDPSAFPYATWGPWAGIAAVAPFALLSLLALGGSEGDDEEIGVGLAVGAQLVQASLFISIPLIIAAVTAAKDEFVSFVGALGFRRASLGRSLKWIGLGALAYYVFLGLVVVIISAPEQDDISGQFGPLWVQFLLIAIVASISEEMFFRGMLFGGLRRRMPMVPAALISGLLFGSMHAPTGPSAVLPLAFFGFVLAVTYERTGSIWPPIALHTLNNSIALIALNAS